MCKKEFVSIRILRRRRYFVHLLHETDIDGGRADRWKSFNGGSRRRRRRRELRAVTFDLSGFTKCRLAFAEAIRTEVVKLGT